jgi:hypothetical protein
MVFGIGTSRPAGGGNDSRRRSGRLLAQSLALALIVPTGLAQVAQAATQPGGLGRPDAPKSHVTKVKAFDGPGAKEARAKVARERKANAAQVQHATAERKTDWPQHGTATVSLTPGTDRQVAPSGVSVTLSPAAPSKSRSAASAATAAAGEAQVTVLDQNAAQKAGVTGVLLTAAADTPGAATVSPRRSVAAGRSGCAWCSCQTAR